MYEISNNTGRYCIECNRELGYLDPKIRTFYKSENIDTQSAFSIKDHPKFKKKRQRCFDCAIKKFGSVSYRPNVHHSDFTGYLFDVEIDKSNVGVTLEIMIKRHGEEEGRKRFDEYRSKQAYTNTFEYKKKKYNWDREKYDRYNKSRAVTLENMTSKYGEEEGRKRFDEYRSKQAYTNTLDYFIDKYGLEVGKKEYQRVCKEKAVTLENMIRIYGHENGIKIFEDILHKKSDNSTYYSKISQELFDVLDQTIKCNSYYGSKNHEFGINDGFNYYCFDYVIPEKKKIIEFNGDYWHANPQIYSSDWVHPTSNKSALEIWNLDSIKIDIAKQKGYNVLIVWESHYIENKEEIIKQCLEFLNED